MARTFFPILALLFSTALLVGGHGLMLTILPLRAELNGFSFQAIGLTASCYFFGFVAGCYFIPRMVRRVGHIRSFAILATTYSCLALLFHGTDLLWVWFVMRFIAGICISGLYATLESWLNDKSTKETRGAVLSIYTVINFAMLGVGQLIYSTSTVDVWVLFGGASAFLSLAIIPICMTLTLQPAPLQRVEIYLVNLWRLSPIGVIGAVCCGLVTGSFWSVGALYGGSQGLEGFELSLFMLAVVVGGAVLQYPVGWLSDRIDRRQVIFYTASIGFTAASVLSISTIMSFPLLMFLVFCWGGGAFTIYAVCLAYANDHGQEDDFLSIGSGMLLVFGAASAVGAYAAAIAMQQLGPRGLFVFSAVVLFILMVVIIRNRLQEPLDEKIIDEQTTFHAVSRTTAIAYEMDPRATHEDDEKAPDQ